MQQGRFLQYYRHVRGEEADAGSTDVILFPGNRRALISNRNLTGQTDACHFAAQLAPQGLVSMEALPDNGATYDLDADWEDVAKIKQISLTTLG